jgi:DNA-binding LytR/AlgR family response regulator
MQIAICDDDAEDLAQMASYCRQYDPGLTIHTFSSGQELTRAFLSTFYDLVFLDIEMDPPNGYEIALELRSRDPKPEIIFVTQTLNYSVRGYGIALRYLPKPISYAMFASALYQALQVISPPKIAVPYQGTQKIIQTSDIMYVEVIRHQVILHMVHGPKLEFRGSLRSVMEQIDLSWFVQSHKSYVVNLHYVDSVTPKNIILTNQETVPIGRNNKAQFEQRLQEFLRGRATHEFICH